VAWNMKRVIASINNVHEKLKFGPIASVIMTTTTISCASFSTKTKGEDKE
jgi:hypothetical protein